MSAPPANAHPGRPWTVRVATWSARHRWPVLWPGSWPRSACSGSALPWVARGRRAPSARTPARSTNRFGRGISTAAAAPSARVPPASRSTSSSTAHGEGHRSGIRGQALGDIAGQLQERDRDRRRTTVPVFDTVTDPLTAPPTAGLVSQDLSSARIVAFAGGEGIALSREARRIPALPRTSARQYPGLEIHALSNRLANDEISELVNHDLDGSLRLTIPITFVILLIAFGALVAASCRWCWPSRRCWRRSASWACTAS